MAAAARAGGEPPMEQLIKAVDERWSEQLAKVDASKVPSGMAVSAACL
jgi:hypothetical protein